MSCCKCVNRGRGLRHNHKKNCAAKEPGKHIRNHRARRLALRVSASETFTARIEAIDILRRIQLGNQVRHAMGLGVFKFRIATVIENLTGFRDAHDLSAAIA